MKLFLDYKKPLPNKSLQQTRNNILKKVAICAGAIMLCVMIAPIFSLAETAEEIQSKISEKNNDIARLEAEIKVYQNELKSIGKQKNTLSTSLKELDITQKKLAADISLTTKKIDRTNLKISDLSTDIGYKEKSIINNKQALSLDIRKMYEIDDTSLSESLVQSGSLSSMWNDLDNMAKVRDVIITKTGNLRSDKSKLEDTRDQTIRAKKELLDLKSELADQKKLVEQNKIEKNKLLKQTKNSESAYQKLVKQQTEKKTALENELRDYESKLKFILDSSKLPGGGVLSWPLDDVFVTQQFGKTSASKRLYASGSHSGVDFRATVGTPVKAMADGVVTGTGDTDSTCAGASFGKWVFIEYDDGLSSTFGHLSLIKAVKGQRVSRGDVVAYSGSTGHVTGPHLHVTVYAGGAAKVQTIPSKSCVGKTLTQPLAAVNAYLDPMYYLPPYKN